MSISEWTKSSYSQWTNCVEVKQNASGEWLVRDSNDPDTPPLVFTAAEWEAFIAGVMSGEFDPQ